MKPDTKTFKKEEPEETEQKLQLDDKHNAAQKSGSRPEVRAVIDMCVQSYFTVRIEKQLQMYNYTLN
jgi:hypothetical protein